MLDVSKAIQESDILVKIIKANENFFAEAICFYFNKSLENGKFPNCLKLANITPVFKKGPRTSKNNYRPVSILPIFSKIFERLLSRQLSEFFDNILSKFQCGFRKGYGTQHCLLLMLEIWKEATDNNKAFGALLTDLSKAFDCLSHDLLIAKLYAYGLDIYALNILQDYLHNCKQRTKVDSFYRSYEAILSGVPQGSILAPLLFNIFMCGMFLILNTIYFTDYTDDNTPFVVRDNIADVIKALKEIGENLVNWFSNNKMKLNTDKFYLLSNSQEPNTLKIGDLHINNSLSEKLLRITFDCKLKFNKHIENISQKASQKLNTLAILAPYMGTTKKGILMNAFFKSQFNYCLLVRMCCNSSLNTKINRLHERCLRIAYNDKKSDFNELLVKDGSVSIHHQNLPKTCI